MTSNSNQSLKDFNSFSQFLTGDSDTKDKISAINSADQMIFKESAHKMTELLNGLDDKFLLSILLSAFKEKGTIDHLPCIAPYLKDEDKRVRANAVEAISAISSSERARDLLIPYLRDKDNRVKANTALALWKYEDLREFICGIFDDMCLDQSKWMRASAYYAFGEIGMEEFLNKLIEALEDKDSDACKTAVIALVSYCEKINGESE